MPLIFSDEFTEASTTPLASHVPTPTGTAWAEAEDTAGTRVLEAASSDIVRADGNASPSQRLLYTCTPAPTDADVDVEATISAIPGSTDTPMVLLARYQDTSNYYAAVCYAGGAGTDKKIVKKVAGTFTLIASGDFGTTAADVLKFELRGSTLKLYQNGTERLSITDTAIPGAGSAGLGLGNASDVSTDGVVAGWELDNFKVTEYPAAAPPTGGHLQSEAFRAEAGKRVPEIYLSLSLGAPFNMVVGSHGFSSTLSGNVDGRVLEWGTFKRGVNLLTHALADDEIDVEYTDADVSPAKRRLFQRLWTKYRSTGRRAEVVLTAHGPDSTWVVARRLLRDATLKRPFIWGFSIRPDDGALRNGKTPKLPISAYFPGAHEDVKGFFAPVLYGKFNSEGAGGKGFVPMYLVNQASGQYLLGQGPCNAVTRVYDPDDAPISSTLYALSRTVVSGAMFTLVTFTPPRTEPVLFADAEGLTVNPDGTGGVILNPAEQFLHASRNFIWGDYRSGPYLTTSPVNSDAIDIEADYFTAMGEEGSYRFGGEEQSTGMDVANAYLESTGSYAFWSNEGEIICKVLDHRPPADVYPEPWVEGDTDELGAFGAPSDASVIEKGVTVSYTPDPGRGGYKNTLRVVDKSVSEDVIGTLELPWSASRVVGIVLLLILFGLVV